MNQKATPDLAALVKPMIGQLYSEGDCWDFIRQMFQQGFGLDLARDTERAATAFQELWFQGDSRDPLTLMQPWDLLIIANDIDFGVSDHVGLVVDQSHFVHAQHEGVGVVLGRLRTWKPRLLQLARYRELL